MHPAIRFLFLHQIQNRKKCPAGRIKDYPKPSYPQYSRLHSPPYWKLIKEAQVHLIVSWVRIVLKRNQSHEEIILGDPNSKISE